MNKLKFGMRVRHKIHGFEGIYTAFAKYKTGCDKIQVTPTDLDKDGKVREPEWFDLENIEVVPKKKKRGAEGLPPNG